MPLDFDDFTRRLIEGPLAPFAAEMESLLQTHFHQSRHGDEARWDKALAGLPAKRTENLDFRGPAIRIGSAGELDRDPELFAEQLKAFSPWRKGPWELFGVNIDTEWRSDLKWARLKPHIAPLADRLVLDIGCGNGYYLLRMLAEGARAVIGIDPTLLFLYQFAIAKRFAGELPAHILPLRGEHLPAFGCLDTVFSMGVLYHRRKPVDHLRELLGFLRPGGELVLETLVLPGDDDRILVPDDRYARMANVWYLPTTHALEQHLAEAGFTGIRTVDVTRTTTHEQRATPWMTFQSLADFLDPENPDLTAEGLPAPTRALVIAQRTG